MDKILKTCEFDPTSLAEGFITTEDVEGLQMPDSFHELLSSMPRASKNNLGPEFDRNKLAFLERIGVDTSDWWIRDRRSHAYYPRKPSHGVIVTAYLFVTEVLCDIDYLRKQLVSGQDLVNELLMLGVGFLNRRVDRTRELDICVPDVSATALSREERRRKCGIRRNLEAQVSLNELYDVKRRVLHALVHHDEREV